MDSKVEQSSSERPLFNEAVEIIKMNERAVKLLNLMENGFLLSKEELNSIDIKSIVGGLRIKYPTIDDIQIELLQTIEDQIGIACKEGWTNEQHEQACKEKQSQYGIAAKEIIDVLSPIYEEYGAVASEDIKNRIWENINDIIDIVDPNNISDYEKNYLIKNISAATKQELNVDEARLIVQIKEYYLKNISIESKATLQVENNEKLLSKKELDISDFKKYVENNHQKIERELQQGRELDDIFYRDFYSANTDNSEYIENDPRVQELKRKYAVSINMAWDKYGNGNSGERDILITAMNSYWTYCYVNQGTMDINNIGRFYFNLNPEYVGNILIKVAEMFQENGLHVEMKVPTKGSAFTFNRHDKMVIYFNAKEEEKTMRVIEMLHSNNNEAFDETGVPRFAAEMKDSSNKKMKGVGFGEEPKQDRESFGTIRVKILSKVYQDAKCCGLSINDPRFDFNSSFERYCKEFQVDPKNPAFNLSNDQEKFATIKRITE